MITLRPSRVSEASNSAEKIASWSWMMKRYSWSKEWFLAAVAESTRRWDGPSR